MTDLLTAPTPETTSTTAMSHFVCCALDLPDGTPCRSLCGTTDTYEHGAVDAVDCVVCMELDRVDFCPETPSKRCEWGER